MSLTPVTNTPRTTPEHWLLVSDDIAGPLETANDALAAITDLLGAWSLAATTEHAREEITISRQTLDFLYLAFQSRHAEVTKALDRALEIPHAVLVGAPEYDEGLASYRLYQGREAAEAQQNQEVR